MTADIYFEGLEKWKNELTSLRILLLSTELEENIKWGMPVYSIMNKNVVGISGFKKHYGLWFYQGATLLDKHKVLVNAQEGKTQCMRHLRYYASEDMDNAMILSYVNEAIENQKSGNILKLIPKSKDDYTLPDSLKLLLTENDKLSEHFYKLSDAKQRGYADYITTAKQDATIQKRLVKITPLIMSGEGIAALYGNKKK